MTDARSRGFGSQVKRRFVVGSYALLADNQKDCFIKAQKARRVIVDKINEVLNEFLAVTQLEDNNLAIGNLKARIRMSIIYYYANQKNYLVCGTGNKSEILIGYFTKHGDGACDMEPIGDLYKTEVYKLSESLGVQKEILNKPPRAGLWANQTDEDEIGMSYDLLDQILYLFTEKDKKNTEIAEKLDISVDDVNMIITKIIRSEHKSKVPEIPQKTIL